MPGISIFEYIVENCIWEEDKLPALPKEFSLECYRNPMELSAPGGQTVNYAWADGALDGVLLYHSSSKLSYAQREKLEKICVLFTQTAKEDWEIVDDAIADYLGDKGQALSSIDCFINYFDDNNSVLTQGDKVKAVFIAHALMTKSKNIEAVKFGLAIAEYYELGRQNESFRAAIITLAACEEFAYGALYNMKYWQEPMNIIFDCAKNLHGWGKIHAVKMLDPTDNDEMKDWLWLEGWKNTVMPEYSAYECYVKSGAKEIYENKKLYDELPQIKKEAIEKMREYCNNPNGPMPNYQV